MQKITPFLWFNDQAEEAATLYTSAFKNSTIKNMSSYTEGSPGQTGSVMTVEFEIEGQHFTALNGGPAFRFNPSASFMVNFDPSKDKHAKENLNALWEKLSEGGNVLMPLEKYPFSEHYGWIQDKFGVTWQLILTDPEGEERPFIVPSLMFTGDVSGKAEEAVNLYISLFANSKRGMTARYPKGMEPDKEGTIMFADFMLEKEWFAAMDSARKHDFNFNEAISFLVYCENQEEVDKYWNTLTANGGQESRCGWLKDKFGVSWQIIPKQLNEMMSDKDPVKAGRAMQAMLKMQKIIIADLQKAYDGQ